jgi:hypothetical protein
VIERRKEELVYYVEAKESKNGNLFNLFSSIFKFERPFNIYRMCERLLTETPLISGYSRVKVVRIGVKIFNGEKEKVKESYCLYLSNGKDLFEVLKFQRKEISCLLREEYWRMEEIMLKLPDLNKDGYSLYASFEEGNGFEEMFKILPSI